jgi:hypothetical protein
MFENRDHAEYATTEAANYNKKIKGEKNWNLAI